MKIGWLGGWGVSLEEMKAIAVAHAPDAEHLIYPPVMGAAENLTGCDAVIAWSLGAHLVLEAGARGVKFRRRVRTGADGPAREASIEGGLNVEGRITDE